MRILLVTPFVPHARVGHGTATVAAHVVDHLARRHDVSVACFSFSEQERALAREVGAHCEEVCAVPFPGSTARQWRARLRSVVRGTPYTIALFDVPALRAEVARMFRARRFDVAQFDTTFVGPYVDLVPREATRTALVEIDFTVKPLARRWQRVGSRIKRAWYRRELDRMTRYEPALCRRFDRVFAVSPDDRDALQRLDPSLAVGVFRYGADPALFELPPKPHNDRIALFMGAFLHKPNVEAATWFADRIVPAIRREVPDVSCTFVGGNPPASLKALVDSRGGSMTGRVPDVAGYLARADVGVVPLLSGGGVKLKTIEMMAAAKAIVTTSIGIEGLDVRDGEHVLVADTPDAFAAHVVRLLRDDRLRSRLGQKARELARRDHQWAPNIRRLENEYADLMRTADRPMAAEAV